MTKIIFHGLLISIPLQVFFSSAVTAQGDGHFDRLFVHGSQGGLPFIKFDTGNEAGHFIDGYPDRLSFWVSGAKFDIFDDAASRGLILNSSGLPITPKPGLGRIGGSRPVSVTQRF